MADEPSGGPLRRCANCGAVLYEGTAWCGMCFAPVEPDVPVAADARPGAKAEAAAEPLAPDRSPDPNPVTLDTASEPSVSGSSDPDTASSPGAMWPCPLCGGRNPIELDVCATCGTPFAALMRQDQDRPQVDRRDAFRRSLLYPGLGHRMVGRELDGVARGVLFTMLLIATLMLGFSGVSSGAVRFLFFLYAAATVGVYLVTALEAARLADGGEPIIPSRTLLWITVAILLITVLVVSLVIGTSTRR